MHEIATPSIDNFQACDLAEHILLGRGKIPELGLTRRLLKQASNTEQEVLDRFGAALTGSDARWRNRCIASVNAMDNRLSTALVNLLAHARCDVFAWTVLSAHVSTMSLPGPMGGRTIVSRKGGDAPGVAGIADTDVHLGDRCHWIGEGVLDLEITVPETALAACVGRPLAHLFSHPALDPLHLVIEGIDDNGGGGYLVETDYARRAEEDRSIAFADLRERHSWPMTTMPRFND